MLIGQSHFDFSRRVYVMGILNVTPDSFSDGGLYLDPERALERALQMQEEGADVIDVGGESTRPGAEPVEEEEELRRVLPVLKKLVPHLKIPISIDTSKNSVARAALEQGVALLNDVLSLGDPGMAETVARFRVPVVLMHMRGTPRTMQEKPAYGDVVREVAFFLEERIRFAESRGISRNHILIDPGIGFGKRFEDNQTLLDRLDELTKLKAPVVIGVSRKSFLRRLYGDAPDRLRAASVNSAVEAARKGAALLRVHDVGATREAIRLALRA